MDRDEMRRILMPLVEAQLNKMGLRGVMADLLPGFYSNGIAIGGNGDGVRVPMRVIEIMTQQEVERGEAHDIAARIRSCLELIYRVDGKHRQISDEELKMLHMRDAPIKTDSVIEGHRRLDLETLARLVFVAAETEHEGVRRAALDVLAMAIHTPVTVMNAYVHDTDAAASK